MNIKTIHPHPSLRAVDIVRAGLADIIDEIGQAGPDYQPRHAKPTVLVQNDISDQPFGRIG